MKAGKEGFSKKRTKIHRNGNVATNGMSVFIGSNEQCTEHDTSVIFYFSIELLCARL